jgi:hypothetical protein
MELFHEFIPEKVGAFLNVPNEVYRRAPGISNSELRILSRSPLDYHRTRLGLLPFVRSHEMELGSIIHSELLEGRELPYYVQPATYGPENKKWHAGASECRAWLEAHRDRPIISQEEADASKSVARYIIDHPLAQPLLTGGYAEVSLFARYPGCGFLIKGRPDYMQLERDGDGQLIITITDFKTAKAGDTNTFSWEIRKRFYHKQAAMYRLLATLLGAKSVRYFFVILEKGRLPKVNVKQLAASAMDTGDMLIDKDISKLRACRMTDTWPEWSDSSDRPGFIDLPDSSYSDKSLLTGMTSATNDDEEES